MKLLLIGTIGGTNVVSNLGAEVEINVLDIKNNRVLFEVSSKKPPVKTVSDFLKDFEETERIAEKVIDLAVKFGVHDLAFLKKQAD
jgi:hypothetical protein